MFLKMCIYTNPNNEKRIKKNIYINENKKNKITTRAFSDYIQLDKVN